MGLLKNKSATSQRMPLIARLNLTGPIRLTVLCAVACIGFIAAVAATLPVGARILLAELRLEDTQRVAVRHAKAGIVAQVHVHAGAMVNAGVLHLTLGAVDWRETPDGPACRAPLLFVPVALTRSSVTSRHVLKAIDDDLVVNPCLVELLHRIPAERRAVVWMYDVEQCPMNEIAASLHIPENTAWGRRRRGLRDLRHAWIRLRARRK